MFRSWITAVLTVRGADEAIAFYFSAFGAEEIYRNTYPDGRIVAEMAVGPPASGWPMRGRQSQLAGTQGDHVRINPLAADPGAVAFAGLALLAGALCSRQQGRSVTRVSLDCCQRAGRG